MTDLQSDNRLASPNSPRDFPRNLSPNSVVPNSVVPNGVVGGGEPALAPMRAILVDDDALYREAITAELDYHGFSVTAFSSGEPMLAHLATGAEAVRVGRQEGPLAVPVVWAIFPIVHVAQGAGFATGLVRYVLRPDWSAGERLPPNEAAVHSSHATASR